MEYLIVYISVKNDFIHRIQEQITQTLTKRMMIINIKKKSVFLELIEALNLIDSVLLHIDVTGLSFSCDLNAQRC